MTAFKAKGVYHFLIRQEQCSSK